MVDLGLMKICGRCHLSAWGGSRKAFLSTLSGKETRHVNHWPIQPAMRFLLNQAPKPLFAILIVSCAARWKFLKWGSRRLRGAFQSFCDQIMISLTYTYIYTYNYIYNYISHPFMSMTNHCQGVWRPYSPLQVSQGGDCWLCWGMVSRWGTLNPTMDYSFPRAAPNT